MALRTLQSFFWDDLCNGYLEFSKHSPPETAAVAAWTLREVLDASMQMLHPYAPFLTERIHQALRDDENSFLIKSQWPRTAQTRYAQAKEFAIVVDAVGVLRNFRAEAKLPPAQRLEITVVASGKTADVFAQNAQYLRVANCVLAGVVPKSAGSGRTLVGQGYEIVVTDAAFTDQLTALREKKIAFLRSEIARSKAILANAAFVAKAPPAKVAAEREKLARHEADLAVALGATAKEPKK